MLNQKSFTLIEILIISAILVLFSGTLLASYNSFNQQKNLEKEVSRLVDVLSLAKGKAQAGDLDPSINCSGSNEFGGYAIDTNANGYSLKQCCRDVTTKNTTQCGAIIQTYTFHSGVVNDSGVKTFSFYPLTKGATSGTIRLRSTSINKCFNVLIAEIGTFTISDVTAC